MRFASGRKCARRIRDPIIVERFARDGSPQGYRSSPVRGRCGLRSEFALLFLDRMIGPALPNKRGLRCRAVKNNGAEPQRKAGPMSKVRFVGLDVHKASITIAVA